MTDPLTFSVSYIVSGCDDCPHRDFDSYQAESYCSRTFDDYIGRKIYEQNRDGLTESCPIIQERKGNDNAEQT